MRLRAFIQTCLHRMLHTDIALSRDEASRFLPWIIALMVYLAMLVLAGSFTLHGTIALSRHAQAQSFSVHAPMHAEKDTDVGRKLLGILRDTTGVSEAELIGTQRIQAMIAPWFGSSDVLAGLPLPVVIEAKIRDNAVLDFDALKTRIRLIAPDATIDDHKRWMEEFSHFLGVAQITLLLIALLIVLTTAAMVIFACRTSLKIHRNTVNLLHRLGAVDSYIAIQFQNHAAFLTLKGACIGSGFASFTLIGLHMMARNLDSPLFPAFALSPLHWLILLIFPFMMTVLALAAARFSVLRSIRKLP